MATRKTTGKDAVRAEGQLSDERNDPAVDKLIDRWLLLKKKAAEANVAAIEAHNAAMAAMVAAGIVKSPGHGTYVAGTRTYTDMEAIEDALRKTFPATWRKVSKTVIDPDALERQMLLPTGKALTRVVEKYTTTQPIAPYLRAGG